MVNYANGFQVGVRMAASNDWGQRSSVLLAILSSERAIIRAMTASAAKEDVTLQQFSVLGVLSRHRPGAHEQAEQRSSASPLPTSQGWWTGSRGRSS